MFNVLFLACLLIGIQEANAGGAIPKVDATYVDTWHYATPQLYMIGGSSYARWDVKSNTYEGANDLSSGYPGVPFDSFDTTYVDTWSYSTPQLYIFHGDSYARYDIRSNQFMGVNTIAAGYPGVPFPEFDATYVDTWSYPTPQLYIFHGDSYARYDIKANQFMGVNTIAAGYPGVPFSEFGATYVDTWSYATPQLYIFRGGRYARYDIKANRFMGVNSITADYPGVLEPASRGPNAGGVSPRPGR